MAWVKTCRECELTFASGEIDRHGRCGACRREAAAQLAAQTSAKVDRIARKGALSVKVCDDDLRTLEAMRAEGGWSSLDDLAGSILHHVCADDRAAESAT